MIARSLPLLPTLAISAASAAESWRMSPGAFAHEIVAAGYGTGRILPVPLSALPAPLPVSP